MYRIILAGYMPRLLRCHAYHFPHPVGWLPRAMGIHSAKPGNQKSCSADALSRGKGVYDNETLCSSGIQYWIICYLHEYGAEGSEEFRQPWQISSGITCYAFSNTWQALREKETAGLYPCGKPDQQG